MVRDRMKKIALLVRHLIKSILREYSIQLQIIQLLATIVVDGAAIWRAVRASGVGTFSFRAIISFIALMWPSRLSALSIIESMRSSMASSWLSASIEFR